MKIIITGAAGFIGFHLCKKLCERGDTVVGIDNFNKYYSVKLKRDRAKKLRSFKSFTMNEFDICKADHVEDLFRHEDKEGRINRIVHLAAQAGVRHSIEYPKEYINTNIVGFHNVLECAKDYGVEGFIYASSSSVYGNNRGENREAQKIAKPISLYAATKATNEIIAYYYHHMFKMHCTGLRFHTVYGSMGRPDMALHLFADGIVKGKPINVFNYGDMERDFTYIDDVIDGIIASIDKNYIWEVFNLASGSTVRLLDYIKCLEKEFGIKAEKNMMPMQPGDVKSSVANISRAIDKLGYAPKTNVDVGIKEFVKWYKEYYKVK